jgi:hypothetical protein
MPRGDFRHERKVIAEMRALQKIVRDAKKGGRR